MPCYTTIEAEVDLGNANKKRLALVLGDMGWSVQSREGEPFMATKGGWRLGFDGKLVAPASARVDTAKLSSEIKRAYAARTVQDTAKRFGWRVKQKQEKDDGIKIKLGR